MRKLISGREVEFNINFALLGGSHLALGLVGGSETQFQHRMWIKFTCEASKWVKNCHPRWSLWRYFIREKSDLLRGKCVALQTEREKYWGGWWYCSISDILQRLQMSRSQCAFYSIFITHTMAVFHPLTTTLARKCSMMDHHRLSTPLFYLKCILSNPLLFDLESDPCPCSQDDQRP